ncbi:MAG: ATP-binding protein [Puniceicoccaceae bacterium]
MNGVPQSADPAILEAYRGADLRRRISRLRVALVFPVVFFPPGALIDLLVYPELARELLWIRILVALVSGLLLFFVRPAAPRPRIVALGVGAALLDIATFCLMVYLTEGAASPYYAGINLIILGLSVLMPWSVWETAFVCSAALALYVAACLLAGDALGSGLRPVFFNNSFFILITGLICVVSSRIQSRARFEDFRLRHQLDLQNRELQALDRLKTNFFSNVTHELRTPLTLILGPVETVLKRTETLDPKIHENLLLAQRNSLRLLKLINDLLDLTRMEQGDDILSPRRIKVASYLAGIVDSVRHLGLAKGVSVRVEEGDPGAVVSADPARLEKVVLNLLTNAIKFTPDGGRVTVAWEQDADHLSIVVSDTGVGIGEADLPRIFDRFYQVSGEAGSPAQGVGIGLALAKELVEQHGGELLVASGAGRGSRFTVRLPRADAAGAEALPLETRSEPPGAEPFLEAFRSADRTFVNRSTATDEVRVSGSGKFTVLVVEDEPDVLRYITGFLAQDHRVVQAGEGREIEKLIDEFEPHLILLDWMLPHRDGLSICRDLRSDPAHADRKIVILTARIDDGSKLEALRAGADDFLLKPFSSVELLTRIENLLRSGELQRDLRDRNRELRETLEKLEKTESQLIQSEKMNALGSLSAGLLHEINNPLNYAFSGIQLLELDADRLDGDVLETVGDIREGIQRVIDVIRDLKTFAYPETPGQRSTFPVREVLDAARKIASRELDGILIEEDIPGDLSIDGQKTQWIHVFINLLSNAGKALRADPPDDGPRVRLEARREDGKTVLRCEDNGPGIPAEIRKRIFDPFFTTRDVGEGMGMGLSICRTIVENHGGRIEVESVVDRKTVFTIILPEPR